MPRVSLFLALALLFSSPARAEKIAIASFRTLGEHMTEPARGALHLSLTGGLAAAGFDIVSDEEQTQKLRSIPGLAGCETSACLKRLGEVLNVKAALKANIEMIGTSRYLTSLELVDTDSGRELARVDDTCEVCTLSEANDAVSNAAAALKAKLEPPKVAAPPPTTPAPAALVAAPPPPPGPTRMQKIFRYTGFGLFGVSAVGFAVGFGELGVDHSRDCTPVAPNVNCPQRIDSTNGQIFGFVTGSVALVAGGVLTWLGYRHTR